MVAGAGMSPERWPERANELGRGIGGQDEVAGVLAHLPGPLEGLGELCGVGSFTPGGNRMAVRVGLLEFVHG